MDFVIKTQLSPAYYADFHCLAGSCHDTCCSGSWNIHLTKNDYMKLRELKAPQEIREILDKTVRRLRGLELQELRDKYYAKLQLDSDGTCPLMDNESYCSLQRTCGASALPRVCQEFPRQISHTPMGKEKSLSPACEGVLQLLWELTEGIDFVETPLDKPMRIVYDQASDEPMLWAHFTAVRSLCIDILQNRTMALNHRIVLMGMALQSLMQMDWADPDMDSWLARFTPLSQSDAAVETLKAIPGNTEMYLAQNMRTRRDVEKYLGLKINKEDSSVSFKVDMGLYEISVTEYQEYAEKMKDAFGDIEYFFENIAVTLFFHMCLPNLKTKDALWKSYVTFCNLFSYFRYSAVMGCGEEPTKERLIHALVASSRGLLHNKKRNEVLSGNFFQNDSATLAHMAILVSE